MRVLLKTTPYALPVKDADRLMADGSAAGRAQPFCLWAKKTSTLLYCCLQKPQMWISGLTSPTTECPVRKPATALSWNEKLFDTQTVTSYSTWVRGTVSIYLRRYLMSFSSFFCWRSAHSFYLLWLHCVRRGVKLVPFSFILSQTL